MRAEAKAAILCLAGALAWFAPWLRPDVALLGTHPATYRPFDEAVSGAQLEAIERAAHPLYGDKLLQHDPEVRFTVDRGLRGGGAPTWNPQVLGGLPHLATGLSSALHPPMWLAWLIPPPRCYAWIAVLQTALAGFFAFWMLRSFGVRPAAAGCGALLYAGSGWMSVHQEYFQLAGAAIWLPLALGGAKRIVDKRGGGFALGAAVAGSFLSGFPQIAVYALLAPALWFVAGAIGRLAQHRTSVREVVGQGATLALFVSLGLAVAAPQLLATAEFVPHSTRQPLTPEVIDDAALPPGALVGALLPDLLVRSWTRAELSAEQEAARQEGRPARETSLFGLAVGGPGQRNNRFEITFAIGPAALLFALAALLGIASGRSPGRWCFAGLLALGLVLALPGPLLRACSRIPGLDIGDPKRALVLVTIGLAGLAALGIERALDDLKPRRRTLLLLLGGTIVLGSCAAWARTVEVETWRTWLAPRIARALQADVAAIAPALSPDWIRDSSERLVHELAFAAMHTALALVALAWWHVHRRGESTRHALPLAGLLVALTVPLVLLWLDTTSPIPTAGLDARPALVAHLERAPAKGRILRLGPRHEMPPWPPKLPMHRGVRDAQGYVAAYLRSWRDLLEAVDPGSTEVVGARPIADPRLLAKPLFDALDVEIAFAALPNEAAPPTIPGWSIEPLDPPPPQGAPDRIVVWRNQESLGRARLVRRVRIAPDARSVPPQLAADEFAPRDEAWLAHEDAAPLLEDRDWHPTGDPRDRIVTLDHASLAVAEPGAVPQVELVGESSDDLRFKVSGPGGLLVQSDCAYPGWSVRIDGHERPLLRVDHALRGVLVPAGDHVVRFRYVPQRLALGLLIAPAALGALLLASAFLGRVRSRFEH